MRRIAWNSAAAGRSTLLLLFVLASVPADNIDNTDDSLGITSSPLNEAERNTITVVSNHQFLNNVDSQREETARSIIDFTFNENRVRMLTNKSVKIPKDNKGIVYRMTRDFRIHDNWALLYAQKLAIENRVPLYIVFCRPTVVINTTYRHFKFMISAVKQIELECQKFNIGFHLLIGNQTERLSHFVRNNTLGAIVVDFSPLRKHIHILEKLVLAIGSEVPVIQVDAHNVIPCWFVSPKELKTPGSLRQRMVKRLDAFLTEFPPVIKHPYSVIPKTRPADWRRGFSNLKIDKTILSAPYIKPGYIIGMSALNYFIGNKLERYHVDRINPSVNGLSNLSPWLHFGHISAQRVLLEILKLNSTYTKGVVIYKEEILVRRELSENYCYYNSNYDTFEGGPSWGRDTLNKHRNDTRPRVYSRKQLELSVTNDDLWNAVNNQMKNYGKIHRFLRPYWAKKILEFSKTPEEAVATANFLNNKYSLDGNDPNGYVGVLWAITGLHDKECAERHIFGTVRFIQYRSVTDKFNAYAYIRKYGNVPKHQQLIDDEHLKFMS